VLSKPITPKSMNVLGHGLALPLNRQSLDLATGPLINFGGASAAYSLRDLNGRNPRIVRVRRASDNHERDFYKDGINSGELTNWVNSQIVPPLDIGVETSEGRIPVPEGGTSIGIPAAAYSLRNLSTTYTGNVVDVRRSSDDAEDSFTAAEVADGTLEAWVNTNFNVKTYDFSSGSGGLGDLSNLTLDGGESIAGVDDALKMSVVSTGSNTVHRCYQNLSALGGGSSLRITFKAYRPSSNVNSGKLGFSFADGFLLSNIEAQFFSADDTWEDFTFDANSGTSTRFYVQLSSTDGQGSLKSVFNGTTGDHVYIKDLKIDVVNSSGFVSQWYDQSGNDNHATDETAASQPKIVDGGTLVTKLGQPSIDFTTGSTVLLSDSFSITETESAVFAIWQPAQDSATTVQARNRTLFGNASSQIYIGTPNSDSQMSFKRFGAVKSFTLGPANLNTPNLHAFVGTTAGADYYFNGSSIYSDTETGTNSIRNDLRIGAKQNLATHDTEGYISELIIYDSDQSANRTAIEANIGETYGITGIPAYDNTVDGFVETWYDQSGNGNDATQLTANDQPRIVISGNLVTSSNGLPAIRVNAQAESFDLDSNIALGNFSLFYAVEHTSFGSAVSWLSNNSGSTYIRYTLTAYNVDTGGVDNGYINLDAELATATNYLISAIRENGIIELSVSGSVQSNTDSNSGILSVQKMFQRGNNETQGLNGYAQELIIYPTDETANRVAIETNINDHYNIY
jgi:hypothetical protein